MMMIIIRRIHFFMESLLFQTMANINQFEFVLSLSFFFFKPNNKRKEQGGIPYVLNDTLK